MKIRIPKKPRRYIVLVREDKREVEVWGSLKGLCKEHPTFSYYTLRNKKFPFKYKGIRFFRVNFKETYL